MHWFAGVLQSLCSPSFGIHVNSLRRRCTRMTTPMMEGLLEALPRLARDAAVGVIVPAWWGRIGHE